MPLVVFALLLFATVWIAWAWYARRRKAPVQFHSTKNSNPTVQNVATQPSVHFTDEKVTYEEAGKETILEEIKGVKGGDGDEVSLASLPTQNGEKDTDKNPALMSGPCLIVQDELKDVQEPVATDFQDKEVKSEIEETKPPYFEPAVVEVIVPPNFPAKTSFEIEDTKMSVAPDWEQLTRPINSEILSAIIPGPDSVAVPLDAMPDVPTRAPEYRPLRPVPAELRPQRSNTRNPRPVASNNDVNLDVRVRLIFQARKSRVALSVVPERKEGMPLKLHIDGTLGVHPLSQMTDSYFADIIPNDLSQALRDGVDFRGKDAQHRRFRWVFGGRELCVLAPDGDGRLSGFVSIPRLLLGEEHLVLATASLETEVRTALDAAGCPASEVWDESTAGVPTGWRLFHGVKPTRAIPARDEAHLLNALCPLADVQPHFIGGIRLERRTWLFGHPPKIHFTGDLGGIEVKLDGQIASFGEKGLTTAPGWDAEGEHLLWFGGQTMAYALQRANEGWEAWAAHDFGAGSTICGASLISENNAKSFFVRVPRGHPVIIGAYPGEIATVPLGDCRGDSWFVRVPFDPVWALPDDPLHADKATMQVHLVGDPLACVTIHEVKSLRSKKKASYWCRLINDAGRKHLGTATDQMDLWRSYRDCARRLLPRIQI